MSLYSKTYITEGIAFHMSLKACFKVQNKECNYL